MWLTVNWNYFGEIHQQKFSNKNYFLFFLQCFPSPFLVIFVGKKEQFANMKKSYNQRLLPLHSTFVQNIQQSNKIADYYKCTQVYSKKQSFFSMPSVLFTFRFVILLCQRINFDSLLSISNFPLYFIKWNHISIHNGNRWNVIWVNVPCFVLFLRQYVNVVHKSFQFALHTCTQNMELYFNFRGI